MRKMKFRAWNKFFEEMYYFDFENNIDVRNGVLWITHKEGMISCQSPNITIMQYTGALDKKGKEIYEGDIVNCSEYGCYGKIYWDEELFSFMFATLCEDGTLFYERFYDYVDDMEIIGNIYENPELMEVEQ